MVSIDLNSDLGENTPDRQVSDDSSMLKIVTSANVSGGFHAGNPGGIRQTLIEAKEHGVIVGAHPGYNDYANFGRTAVDIDAATLQAEIEYQLGALMGMASSVGVNVEYVKPHGALYNAIVNDEEKAKVVVAAVKGVNPNLVFLGLAGSVGVDIAERTGLTVAREAFADRAYTPDGALMSRSQPGSVLNDADEVSERMHRLVRDGSLLAADDSEIRIDADSICVHGDSTGAIDMAAAVRRRLAEEGIDLKPFTR